MLGQISIAENCDINFSEQKYIFDIIKCVLYDAN